MENLGLLSSIFGGGAGAAPNLSLFNQGEDGGGVGDLVSKIGSPMGLLGGLLPGVLGGGKDPAVPAPVPNAGGGVDVGYNSQPWNNEVQGMPWKDNPVAPPQDLTAQNAAGEAAKATAISNLNQQIAKQTADQNKPLVAPPVAPQGQPSPQQRPNNFAAFSPRPQAGMMTNFFRR